jgi:hypothetical protein
MKINKKVLPVKSEVLVDLKNIESPVFFCSNVSLVWYNQSAPKTTIPMPQSSKIWFELVKIA